MNLKPEYRVSIALWIPMIWYGIGASRTVGRWLDIGSSNLREVDYLGGNPLDRNIYLGLTIIGIFILSRRKINWLQLIKNNYWIFILIFYMAFSILWSDFKEVAFKRWIKAVGSLIMVLIVLTESNPMEAISRLLRRCFFIHLPLSVMFIKYYRTIGVAWDYLGHEMWIGVTTHKNVLGEVTMISGNFFIWRILKSKVNMKTAIDLLFLMITIWLLFGSNSSTAITVFIIGLFILLLFYFMRTKIKNIRRNMIISIFFIAILYIILHVGVELYSQQPIFVFATELLGRDSTLTGRTDLWKDILSIASQNPILGVGYGSFWVGNLSNNLWEKHIWQPIAGHNGYIDVYVELGLVGIFLLIFVIIFAYRDILNTFEYNVEYGLIRLTFMTMIVMHNFTESSYTIGSHHLWFIFLLITLSIPQLSHINNFKELSFER